MNDARVAILCLGVPMLFYLGQASFYYLGQGRIGMTIAFAAYAVANVGFILDAQGI